MGSANARWRYIVTSSLIGWTHTQYNPCLPNVFIDCSHVDFISGNKQMFVFSVMYPFWHDDVIKWSVFHFTGPLCWESTGHIYRSPVDSPHKDQWRSKQSGRRWFERNCAHYDVTVMEIAHVFEIISRGREWHTCPSCIFNTIPVKSRRHKNPRRRQSWYCPYSLRIFSFSIVKVNDLRSPQGRLLTHFGFNNIMHWMYQCS